ncbi:DEAD/DEAH box helicase [Myroides sp. LJL119]
MNIERILSNLSIDKLNAMQDKTLEVALNNNQVVLLSPTGSGKTLAFLLPIISKLKKDKTGVQALIIVPTRELAQQIEMVFKSIKTGYKINAIYGGHSTQTQIKNFSTPASVLVGTPGRIVFHLAHHSFDPSSITQVVIDEFDKALEMGFEQQMISIFSHLKHVKFKMLTSATTLKDIPEFVQINNPVYIDFLHILENKPKLSYSKVLSEDTQKLDDLIKLIAKIPKGLIIIFCNHRDAVDRISETLSKNKVANSPFHGALDQDTRQRALTRFKNGSSRILICTDLASRGLDIPEISNVIHYQMPLDKQTFIHRNGRTARMSATGSVHLMLNEHNQNSFDYLDSNIALEVLDHKASINNRTEFQTIYISAGKKDKINKVDIVGYFIKTLNLDSQDLGLIQLNDHQAFVAIRWSKVNSILKSKTQHRIKNKKVKIALAKE